MEFVLPELLSRDDILRILNQRQLHIRNMNELTNEELMRIYKTFVMPLSRRPERCKRTHIQCSSINHSNKDVDIEEQMHVEPSDSTCISMDVDVPYLVTNDYGVIGTHIKRTSPLGEKRRQRDIDDEYVPTEKDYQFLNSATKRIKINSS